MQIIRPSYEILNMPDSETIYEHIEKATRICYKSEDKIEPGSAEKLLRSLVKSGHHSVFEHISVSVKFIVDRGVSHELVRHRLASYSQESTRYCNYDKKGLKFIKPCFWKEGDINYTRWVTVMRDAQDAYKTMIHYGAKPQEARSVLPNSLATEIIMTANLREWRHVFNLRCSKAAHPQIREVMKPLLCEFNSVFSVYYSDLVEKYIGEVL